MPKADAVAVLSDSGDELTVFAVNRDQREPLPVDVDLRSLPAWASRPHHLAATTPDAANTRTRRTGSPLGSSTR